MFLSLCDSAMEQYPLKGHPWGRLTQTPQILQGFSNIEPPIRMTGTQGSVEYGRCASLAFTLSEAYSLVTFSFITPNSESESNWCSLKSGHSLLWLKLDLRFRCYLFQRQHRVHHWFSSQSCECKLLPQTRCWCHGTAFAHWSGGHLSSS